MEKAAKKIITTRCCIAGGGPAGIMLGYLLARAGIDVVVLEKWPDFFRDFRGDTIHPSTMTIMHELGLLEEFLKVPHSVTTEVFANIGGKEFRIGDFSRLNVVAPFIGFMPQWDFLNFLTLKAKAFPHFHLMMETEATDVIEIEENGKMRVAGVRAKAKNKGASGADVNSASEYQEIEIRAELVIGADGRHSVVREKAKLEVIDLGAPVDVLWFRLSRTEDNTKRSLGYVNDGKFFVMLDRDDYWQCAFVIKKGSFDAFKARGLAALRADISGLVPSLASAVEELKDWEQVKFLSVAVDHLKKWYRDGLLCIGDSAHAMSPVAGVGINLAIQDAVAAANILVPAFARGVPTLADLAAVERRRELPTWLIQRVQTFLHHRLLEPILERKGKVKAPLILRIINRFPPLQWIPARIVGIGYRPEHVL